MGKGKEKTFNPNPVTFIPKPDSELKVQNPINIESTEDSIFPTSLAHQDPIVFIHL